MANSKLSVGMPTSTFEINRQIHFYVLCGLDCLEHIDTMVHCV